MSKMCGLSRQVASHGSGLSRKASLYTSWIYKLNYELILYIPL